MESIFELNNFMKELTPFSQVLVAVILAVLLYERATAKKDHTGVQVGEQMATLVEQIKSHGEQLNKIVSAVDQVARECNACRLAVAQRLSTLEARERK